MRFPVGWWRLLQGCSGHTEYNSSIILGIPKQLPQKKPSQEVGNQLGLLTYCYCHGQKHEQSWLQVIINWTKTIIIVSVINYASIHLTCINFIKLYLTNFWNKKKALNNLTHSTTILVTGNWQIIRCGPDAAGYWLLPNGLLNMVIRNTERRCHVFWTTCFGENIRAQTFFLNMANGTLRSMDLVHCQNNRTFFERSKSVEAFSSYVNVKNASDQSRAVGPSDTRSTFDRPCH